MLDFKHWDLVQHFTVRQAASLWCDLEPGQSDLLSRVDHPEIVAIEQLLVSAVQRGKLPSTFPYGPYPQSDKWLLSTVTRADLKSYAEHIGERPKFLFPDERNRSKEKSSVATEATHAKPNLS